jgi:type 1 fimbria pilin
MKFIHYVLLLGLALALGGMPSKAMAKICNTPFQLVFAPLSTANVDLDAPIGVTWPGSDRIYWAKPIAVVPGDCPGLTFPNPTFPGPMMTRSTYPQSPLLDPNGFKIFDLGIPGFGLRIKEKGYCSGGGVAGWPNNCSIFYSDPSVVQLAFDIYKTGPAQPGTTSGTFGTYALASDPTDIVALYVWGGPIVIGPNKPTCNVATPSVVVPLGSVPRSAFTGLGSSSAETAFNLQLTCSGGDPSTSTGVYVTLTDATNPGNTSTTLSLKSGSTATGIGIQTLFNDTVLSYGPPGSAAATWQAGSVAQSDGTTTFTVPLRARYVQTDAKVTPGTANGMATFTMTYQ